MIDRIYYTPEEVSKMFRLSLSTIYNLIERGELPGIKLGKCYRIPEVELNSYLQGKTARSQAPAEDLKIPETAGEFIKLIRNSTAAKSIVDIFIYGSYARGDYNADSDIDMLVILKEFRTDLNDAIAEMCDDSMALAGYDDLLSVIQLSKDQWDKAGRLKTPFYNSVNREGISLWKR